MRNLTTTRRMPNAYFCVITSLMLLFAQGAFAQAGGLDADSAKLTGERPNAGGTPTEIKIGLFVFDVDSIDDANQTFNADLFLTASWNDSRLALPKRKRDGLIRQVSLQDIWTPRGLIVNERGLNRVLPQVAEIDDLGNVLLQQRVIGSLALDLNFQEFPFDTQYLPIEIVSYAHNTNELTLTVNEKLSGSDGYFTVEGWELTLMEPKVSEFRMTEERSAKPRVVFLIGAVRDSGYYLLTLFLPMALIILMSWSVFWLQPDIIPARIGISTASIFSFVAFGFTIRSRLPEVSYMTRADLYVTGCTLMVFLALAVAIAGSRLANAERMDEALRLSAIGRWAYLLLFALVVILTIAY